MAVAAENGAAVPLLEARGVTKRYGHVNALRGTDLDLRAREIHALIGDNGAGKSTLVKVLSGVLRRDGGTVRIDGRDVDFEAPSDAHGMGVETVYQDLALAPTLDAGENVFLGRELASRGLLGRLGFIDRRQMRRRTEEELARLGISLPAATAPVGALSGGQRQAVAIARAAIWGRRILILDEPTAALGPQQTEVVLGLMRKVRDEQGLSVLWVSHNLPQVLEVADRITVLRLGERVLTASTGEVTAEGLMLAMTGLVRVSEDGESR
jgi:simple sugar transport system ATP-binding protein